MKSNNINAGLIWYSGNANLISSNLHNALLVTIAQFKFTIEIDEIFLN